MSDVVNDFLKAIGTYICPCGRCSTNRTGWAVDNKNLEKCPNENSLWHTDLEITKDNEVQETEASDTIVCNNDEISSDTLVWRKNG